MYPIRLFLHAWQYFTRIPLPKHWVLWLGFDTATHAASICMLPLVGCCVGLVAALAWLLGWWLLPAVPATDWVCALLALAAMLYMTGALHEDGLADMADGLGGSADRERALHIMKDSRVGSFAVLALTVSMGLKTALLAAMAQSVGSSTVLALVLAQVVSRANPLLLMATLPNVSLSGQSKSHTLAAGSSRAGLLWAAACVATALLLGWWIQPQLSWGLALSGTFLMGIWVKSISNKRIQGYTGDILGASQQLGELGFYMGLLMQFSPLA